MPEWSDATLTAVFAGTNDWSVKEYWSRATLNLLELQLTLFPWRTLPGNQGELDKARGDVDQLVRKQAAADGVPLDQFDSMVALIHPPPVIAEMWSSGET
ncbi:MAG: hypothetical protein H0X25_12795 [Acidobacteriales bacterium]|nr:hypothetical protein [Terriglobales bacterium]